MWTPAATDLTLAIAHHILVFSLAAVLAFEIAVLRRELTAADIVRLSRVDIWYGIIAGLILIVGFSRAIFAAKGWAYYSQNLLFWAKISTFALIGLLSIRPTVSIIGWRRGLDRSNDFSIQARDIATARRYLFAEAALFPLLLIFAAGMARGYGLL